MECAQLSHTQLVLNEWCDRNQVELGMGGVEISWIWLSVNINVREGTGKNWWWAVLLYKESMEAHKLERVSGLNSLVEFSANRLKIPGLKNSSALEICFQLKNAECQRWFMRWRKIKEAAEREKALLIVEDFNYPHIGRVNTCSGHVKGRDKIAKSVKCLLRFWNTLPREAGFAKSLSLIIFYKLACKTFLFVKATIGLLFFVNWHLCIFCRVAFFF